SNYIEVAVALVEAVLLIGVAVPLWAKAVDKFPKDNESTVVQVVAQQFNWNVRYPGKDGVFGKQSMQFVDATNVFGIDPTDTNGAQLCGNGHSTMASGFLVVEIQEAFDKWLASKAGAATSFE